MTSTTRLEVNVELPFRTLFWAMLHISVSATRYVIGFLGLACLGYLITQVYHFLPLPEWNSAEYFASLLQPFAIGGGFIVVFLPLIAALRTRQALRAEGMHGRRRYIFTPEEISIESPLASATVKWPAYIRVKETRSLFLLYSAASFANVLPKRCFKDGANISAFRDLVRQKIRKAALRR